MSQPLNRQDYKKKKKKKHAHMAVSKDVEGHHNREYSDTAQILLV